MTKIYNAGEHVKVVKSDPGYNGEIGDQTGLVGTVMEGTSGGGAFVVFPHNETPFYYTSSEVVPAGTPTPEPDFKAGEYVKIIGGGYGTTYANRPLKVRKDAAAGSTYVELDMTYSAGGTASWVGTVLASAVVKTDAPEPEKVYLFREGDHVRFLEGHNRDWTGAEFTVRKDVEKGSTSPWGNYGNYELAKLTVTKPAGSGCRVGEETQVGAHKLEKFTPVPEPKFKVGDWVQVKGYSDRSMWEGFIGKVTLIDDAFDTYVIDNGKGEAYSKGGFAEKYLVAAEKPWTPKFKVGDWVEVVNWSTDWDGAPAEVTSVPTGKGGYYQIKLGAASGLLAKGHWGGFSERHLKASQKPAEPHWTEAKPVGTATRIGARTLVKVEEDKWLFVYDTDSNYPSTTWRNNAETKNLFKFDAPTFVNAL